MIMTYKSAEIIKSLKQTIENFTTKSFTDLTEAIQELKNRYIDADTVDGWNVNVVTDDSDIENITEPTITFMYTVGG